MQGSTRIDELRQKFHENPRRYFAPLANEYRKAGDPEQAIAICRAHLAQQPGHMSGHVVYGQALYDAKRTDEARAVFEKALALDPDNAIVLKQLGDIAREKGDTSEARHWYSRALEADPNDRETAAYIAELTEPLTEDVEVEQPVAVEPTEEPRTEEPRTEEPQPEERKAEETPATVVEEDVTWRKTPPHEESPFVTRTMAELYASQGYRQAALDVYRQLALQHPDDKEIFDRIGALEKDTGSTAAVPSAEAQPAAEPGAPAEPQAVEEEETAKPETLDFEPMISDMPVEAGADTFTDVSTESVFAPSSEDLNLDIPAETSTRPDPHFTEMELSTGDTWDTDSWGAGFDSDEDLNLDFVSPDVPSAEAPPAEAPPPEAAAETQAAAQPMEAPAKEEEPVKEERVKEEEPAREEASAFPDVVLTEPAAEDLAEEPIEQPVEAAAEFVEEPVAEPETEPVAQAVDAFPEVSPEVSYEEEPEPEDASHVVAYSPQLPEEDELPHYAPKGPTVREFFAALGAFRPSAKEGSSITAHAASTAVQEEPSSTEYPLASDAFSNLFSDSPVSEEDSRAAFALSGALGASEPTSAAITAPQEPQTPPEPASPAPTQESEEDIRRFREWLDGLADS
jgi:tetratricopeptide (TPR) repeat protein